jgi:hypothetical protein
MLAKLLRFCESRLGEEARRDVRRYDTERPKRVSARARFVE